MSQHTAGPWSNTPMQDTVWAHDGQVQVAKVSDLPWINGKSDWLTEQANATLIAAAPELLASLLETLCYLEADSDDDTECVDYARAKAVIAKATGGAQ